MSSTVVWWFLGKKNNFCLCAYYYTLHCIYISIIAVLSSLPVTDALEGVFMTPLLSTTCSVHIAISRLYPGQEVGGKTWDMTEWLDRWMHECRLLRWIYIHTTIIGSMYRVRQGKFVRFQKDKKLILLSKLNQSLPLNEPTNWARTA